MNIYHVQKEYESINKAIHDADGEITEEVEAWLTALDDKTDESIAYMCQEVSNLEAHAAMISAEASKLAGRASAMKNGAKRFRAAILEIMKLRAIKKIKTLTHSVVISKKSAIEIFDDEALQSTGYVLLKATPDKKAIKKAIDSGLGVPGARLVETESVRIVTGKKEGGEDDEAKQG